jgi:nitrogen fixation protein FixH
MKRTRPNGWWYPWIFVAGMMVVVIVNAVMISYAIGTFPGLQTEDAYRKGLAYNQTLDAAREQEARGWRADVRLEMDGAAGSGRTGELTVLLSDGDGQPLPDQAVLVVLLRPTHRGQDVTVVLHGRGEGRYGAAVALPGAGQWDAWIRVSGPAGNFQTTQRVLIP